MADNHPNAPDNGRFNYGDQTQTVREPPFNEDAERSVLGAILIDNRSLDAALAELDPGDFYREQHRHTFRTMIELHSRDEPVDVITLADHLESDDRLEAAGGASYLARLSNAVPSAANIAQYISIVRRKSMLRRYIAQAEASIERAYSGVENVEEFFDDVESDLFSVTAEERGSDLVRASTLVSEAFSQIEAWTESGDDPTGVTSMLPDLDVLTGGWEPAKLIVMAARPGMGKTSFALQCAAEAARQGNTVGFFSLEMDAIELIIRILAQDARIDTNKMKRGLLNEQGWARLIKSAGDIKDLPIYIDDTPGITVLELRSKARQLKSEDGLGILFVDYLQLMRGGSGHDNREQEIAHISRSLKGLAKELHIPVIALAQLNRGVEKRADKRPLLSDLRESGSIEQDSDIVEFIYRDEVYNENTEERGVAEIIVRKNRSGPVGTVRSTFIKEFTRFDSLAPYWREDQ